MASGAGTEGPPKAWPDGGTDQVGGSGEAMSAGVEAGMPVSGYSHPALSTGLLRPAAWPPFIDTSVLGPLAHNLPLEVTLSRCFSDAGLCLQKLGWRSPGPLGSISRPLVTTGLDLGP